jgi:hypothetical protein
MDIEHGDSYSITMARESQATLLEPGPISSSPVADTQALIEEARRRHRRRRFWIAMVCVAAVVVGLFTALATGGFGGNVSRVRPSPPGDTVAPSAPPVGGSAPSVSAAALGHGATSIDFVNPQQGWIATGCSHYCYDSNPVIIRTGDGGRTWRSVHPPDMAAKSVSGSVWYQYGGVVDVRFVSPPSSRRHSAAA